MWSLGTSACAYLPDPAIHGGMALPPAHRILIATGTRTEQLVPYDMQYPVYAAVMVYFALA
jgi:hypothetical protein